MNGENGKDEFCKDRVELFEALGHPTRIKILQRLANSPMGFSDLKKVFDIESSGLLQFHLGKLQGLVKTTQEGTYTLTDEGKEALRSIVANADLSNNHLLKKINRKKTKILAVVLALVIIISVGLAWNAYLANNLNSLNAAIENVRFVGAEFSDVELYQNVSTNQGDLAFRWELFCDNPTNGRLSIEIRHLDIHIPIMGNRSLGLNANQYSTVIEGVVEPHSKIKMNGTLFFNTTLNDALLIMDYLLSNGTNMSYIEIYVAFFNDCPYVVLYKTFDSHQYDIYVNG